MPFAKAGKVAELGLVAKIDDAGLGVAAAADAADMTPAEQAVVDEIMGTCNSFTAATPVLMADGKAKQIRDVKVGDVVEGTNPTTWIKGPHKVTALIRHSGPHRMVDVTLSDGSVIHATDHHPFWDATTGTFTDAVNLKPGDRLRGPDGQPVTVASTRVYEQNLTAYNLTIDAVHTYYVEAGSTPVLVHNALKCVNLPSWKNIDIDMNEVLSGHTVTGERYLQSLQSNSKVKDIFPENMSPDEIQSAIRQAYRNASMVGATQYRDSGDVVMYMMGSYDGMDIYMYVNKTTGLIETAWPKYP